MSPPSARSPGTQEPPIGPTLSCFRRPAEPGSVRLEMVGELDLATAGRAGDALASAQTDAGTVVCDLRDVAFVDVCGLHVLANAAARCRRDGGHLTVVNSPPIVRRLVRLLGLDDTLDLRRVQDPHAARPCSGSVETTERTRLRLVR